ncbi:MAG TPA: fructose-bisphosphate aldolase [bacterium]|nr:fructose-bisphosphate aldolase [bacterium]
MFEIKNSQKKGLIISINEQIMTSDVLERVKKYLKEGRCDLFSVEDSMYSKEKQRRIKRISLSNGKFFILPIDQGLEHGPVDFLGNPDCDDPVYQLELAVKGGFSAVAMHYGLAKRYWSKPKYKKNIPLVLKLNGKTQIPKVAPFSTLDASVEEGLELGAEAIGYTLYVGSNRQDEDIAQLAGLREKLNKVGLPLIVWAYPRGERISGDGGKDSIAAVDYAVRTAMELGADIVKYNMPKFPKGGFATDGIFANYNNLQKLNQQELLQKVVKTAGTMGTLLSGGDLDTSKQVVENAELAMKTGMDGIIFGRNIWQRDFDVALALSKKLRKIILSS